MHLREFRKSKGLSQAQLAQKITDVGINTSQKQVSFYEKRARRPTYDFMCGIKILYPEASIDYIFFDNPREILKK